LIRESVLASQRRRLVLPFAAIVDMDKLKLAILINAINPKIGGVLIRGPKGSGKSTIVRSLTDILPKIRVVKGCPFKCNPDDPSNMCPVCLAKYKKGEAPSEEREMVVVDLPLGATEDRVIGSLDVEKAIKQGIEALEPGILAEANQNILYVDEVNLLQDHIADDLLDAAATGWNIVEREGVSVSHPSRFILIGTMNPEEGELRPQLLDRFPLSVTVETIGSIEDRVEVVKRTMKFEAEPEKFYEEYMSAQSELRRRIVQAREVLNRIVFPENLIKSISKACLDLKVDGLRPDIIIAKAAATLAAFEVRTKVTTDDVLVAADLTLSHRTRQGGFIEPASSQEIKETFTASLKNVFQFEESGGATTKQPEKKHLFRGKSIFWVKKDAPEQEEERANKDGTASKAKRTQAKLLLLFNRALGGVIFGIGRRLKKSPEKGIAAEGLQRGSSKLKGEIIEEKVEAKKDDMKGIPIVSKAAKSPEVSAGHPIITGPEAKIVSPSKYFLKMGGIETRRRSVNIGRHAQAVTAVQRGKPYGWAFPHGKTSDIHIPATIREASRKQKTREKPSDVALKIIVEDLREKLRSHKAPLTMVFVVDLSGSMLFNLGAVKEALLRLHGDARRYRDRVGIVALKDLGAVVVQHPITNLRVIASKLTSLRISGYTPLATGMLKAWEVLKEAERRDPSTVPVMVIVTDGSANVPLKKSLDTGEVRRIEEARVIVREYEDLAVNDALSVSTMIKHEGIHTIVVNTNPHAYGRETYGFWVTSQIASKTNGTHHIVGRLATREQIVKNMVEHLQEDEQMLGSKGFLD
jgi:Mg-chelatase subunit ChlI/Mg-chelatase subunit ChlD